MIDNITDLYSSDYDSDLENTIIFQHRYISNHSLEEFADFDNNKISVNKKDWIISKYYTKMPQIHMESGLCRVCKKKHIKIPKKCQNYYNRVLKKAFQIDLTCINE